MGRKRDGQGRGPATCLDALISLGKEHYGSTVVPSSSALMLVVTAYESPA